jgi:thiol-disulfide isomerase/thioredoxin
MVRRVLAAVTAFALTAAAARAEGELSVGDPAPKLEVKEFVKGDPVKALAKGKVYVVEFWATWCGPCRATIPHLTELQKKHKDVTVIGVSVYERDPDKVKPFVREMGAKMDYRVATDAVPAGKEAGDGAMAKAWMDAAGQEGIPTAFIVSADGRIAWIGHPAEMDKPLAEVAAGKWDVAAAAAKYKEQRALERKLEAVAAKIQQAQKAGDKAVLAALDAALKDDPKLEPALAEAKFDALCGLGDVDAAVAYGRKMVDELFKDNAHTLNEVAWGIVQPDKVQDKKPDAKLVKLALAAATKANDLQGGKDANVLDTLAQAHFVNGDVAKAVECQEKAIKLEPDNPELKERLATFQKARKKD